MAHGKLETLPEILDLDNCAVILIITSPKHIVHFLLNFALNFRICAHKMKEPVHTR